MNILLTAATAMEIMPFVSELTPVSAYGYRHKSHQWRLLITGAGMMATTYSLTKVLQKEPFDLVIQAGICGSFDRQLALGTVVFVTTEQLGDFGAEDHYKLLDIFELQLLARDTPPFTAGKLPSLLPEAIYSKIQLPEATGLTVQQVAGTDYTAAFRLQRFACTVESMEGAALHYACLQEVVPFAQIRAVSNYVEARNRAAWNIPDAVENLNHWLTGFADRI